MLVVSPVLSSACLSMRIAERDQRTRSRSSSIRLTISPLENASRPLLPEDDDSLLSAPLSSPQMGLDLPPIILSFQNFESTTNDIRIYQSSSPPTLQYLESALNMYFALLRYSPALLLLHSILLLSLGLPSLLSHSSWHL
jgi:hypothetical protein